MKPQVIFVTGATGAVGPRIVNALLEAGNAVRTLSLAAPPPGAWPAGVDERLGDVSDMALVQRAMQGVDATVHLAALCLARRITPPRFHCQRNRRFELRAF